MSMNGILFLGFLVGMAHALEADHLAAVGALAGKENNSKSKLFMRGAAWGLGHTITLFFICSLVILLGFALTEKLSATLEFGVGVMLVVLGLDVLVKFRKKQIHFHVHTHKEGNKNKPHIHAHSHSLSQNRDHASTTHEHKHIEKFPLKALLIGLVHGAAGSAGLLALSVAATKNPYLALGYVALFGLGSIIGMAALSLIVMWPLTAVEKHAKLMHRAMFIFVGVLTVYLGLQTMFDTSKIAFAGAI